MDSSSLRFLTAAALAARRKEKKEAAKKEAAKKETQQHAAEGLKRGGRGRKEGTGNFLELPLLVALAWLDSGYVFMRQSSRPLFYILLGSTVDTCTYFCFGGFSEEFHSTST